MKKCIKRPWLRKDSVRQWCVAPTDADIAMSRENDDGGADCNVEGCFQLWRRLSRLGRWRSTNENVDVEVVYRPSQSHTPQKRKAVTFALDWDDRYDEVLCQRCRTQMQTHFHGELCGRCGAIFTINRPWSLPEHKTHHGLAPGTSSAVSEERLTRSQSS